MDHKTPSVKTDDDEAVDVLHAIGQLRHGDESSGTSLKIKPPNIKTIGVQIYGTAPLMTARLSAKTTKDLLDKFTTEESPAAGKKKRKARDLNADMEAAIHRSVEGWAGFPASAIRSGMISACRTAGFKMTLAKLSLFVVAEGYDVQDGLPLVQIHGEYERNIMPVRNATGVIDLRTRPMWKKWNANLKLRFDGDQFSMSDVVNLLQRVGEQVGIGEGRADSRNSAGLGFGSFTTIKEETE